VKLKSFLLIINLPFIRELNLYTNSVYMSVYVCELGEKKERRRNNTSRAVCVIFCLQFSALSLWHDQIGRASDGRLALGITVVQY